MKVKVKVKLDHGAIQKLQRAKMVAHELAAEAVHTDIVSSAVVPKEVGDLEGSHFVDASRIAEGRAVIHADTPYARRLYWHPEYNFRTDKNPNAQGKWMQTYVDGPKKDFFKDAFKVQFKRLAGGLINDVAQVRDWMRTVITCPHWYIGKIDSGKEQCIGLYNTTGPTPNIAVGGLSATGYAAKSLSILVHWGKNADTAECKAQEVYTALFGQSATIGGKRVALFQMRTPGPISVGTDEQNIYEHVIETTIYHER